jgi:hypothetical protein
MKKKDDENRQKPLGFGALRLEMVVIKARTSSYCCGVSQGHRRHSCDSVWAFNWGFSFEEDERCSNFHLRWASDRFNLGEILISIGECRGRERRKSSRVSFRLDVRIFRGRSRNVGVSQSCGSFFSLLFQWNFSDVTKSRDKQMKFLLPER